MESQNPEGSGSGALRSQEPSLARPGLQEAPGGGQSTWNLASACVALCGRILFSPAPLPPNSERSKAGSHANCIHRPGGSVYLLSAWPWPPAR